MSLLLKASPAETAQAGYIALKALEKPWINGYRFFSGRTIPSVHTRLTLRDRLGTLKARWGIARMKYSVLPGLYAVGAPDPESPVFVTGNYKMSFDALRSNLRGSDAWMLILDTKGINVWCAAGKGTFGTDELVARLASVRLGKIVSHRTLILPQLGASGVSSPETARRSGFKVVWGPVRAADIPAWIAAGRVKDDAMKTVTFNLRERMAVAPIEINHSWPFAVVGLAVSALYALPPGPLWLARAIPVAAVLLGSIPVGTVLFPALLPWIPFRAFSLKGATLGTLWAAFCACAFAISPLTALGAALVAVPLTAFLAMNFTGSSTFTCQEGALTEVEKSFWPMIGSSVLGLAALTVSRLFGA